MTEAIAEIPLGACIATLGCDAKSISDIASMAHESATKHTTIVMVKSMMGSDLGLQVRAWDDGEHPGKWKGPT